MGRKKTIDENRKTYEMPQSMTPEGLENIMISKATALAYQQLCDGTASSQVITHFLKLGSSKERLEQEILREQKKLVVAKTENLNDQKDTKRLFEDAIAAMRKYSGNGEANE